MGISHYLKEIGRGARGAKSLDEIEAEDLFGQVLDREASDLEIGGFCLSMRFKSETPAEMSGFLAATAARITPVPPASDGRATVVLPSYNGSRRLPVLTPLLGLMLVARGLRVVVHAGEPDPARVTTEQVLAALGHTALGHVGDVRDDAVNLLPLPVFAPQLAWLLGVRKIVGVRNPAHSLVKLLNPCAGRALVVGSYTHAPYAALMDATYRLTGADAMLLRGVEGEPVADGRKLQQIDAYVAGVAYRLQDAQDGRMQAVADWPSDLSPASQAAYVEAVLAGRLPAPEPVARQVAHIEAVCAAMTGASALAAPLAPAWPTLDEDGQADGE
ncbi:Anthranilate phosphoribosyltransferase like [plant metagenome]|uniref:Anthranilate phosphoribosyltransferase like n=1 Tax=plant metagenome TaxID=1297885 RepID=A0A484SA43_9ZZZZ